MLDSSNLLILSGNSNKPLALEISDKLGVKLGNANIGAFSDSEIRVRIYESLRGRDVFIIQSTSSPHDKNLMALRLMSDACKRADANLVYAVMPYFGYARQDEGGIKRDKELNEKYAEPNSAKLIAKDLSNDGFARIIAVNFHSSKMEGFFDVPVTNIAGHEILYEHCKKRFAGRNDIAVAAPDLGGDKRAAEFSEALNAPMIRMGKFRPDANVSEITGIFGDPKGKSVILVDDIADTAGTLSKAANELMNRGAKEVIACVSHGVLSGNAIERITTSPIKELMMLNTIDIPAEKLDGLAKGGVKVTMLSVAPALAAEIRQLYTKERGISIDEAIRAEIYGQELDLTIPGFSAKKHVLEIRRNRPQSTAHTPRPTYPKKIVGRLKSGIPKK